jgi:osmoprotectant transport system permease protein
VDQTSSHTGAQLFVNAIFSDLWGFISTADNWRGSSGIAARAQAHLWISVVATAIATSIALPPALLLAHLGKAPVLSVGVANIGRALPSFAVIALVLPISIGAGFGLGFWPTCAALVALGIPPIFTNTYTGVATTPAALRDAARGIGMTSSQVLLKVEIPHAINVILTGFRISAVQIVATASLGALVGYQCLGSYVIEGLAQPTRARDRLLTGAVLIAAMAMAADFLFNRVEGHLTRWRRRLP